MNNYFKNKQAILTLFNLLIFTSLLIFEYLYSSKICPENLRSQYLDNFQIFFTGRYGGGFLDLLFCNGVIVEKNINQEFFTVFFNKQIFFIISNIALIIFSVILIKLKNINLNFYIIITFMATFSVNVFFAYPLGLNYLNHIMVNQFLALVILWKLVRR